MRALAWQREPLSTFGDKTSTSFKKEYCVIQEDFTLPERFMAIRVCSHHPDECNKVWHTRQGAGRPGKHFRPWSSEVTLTHTWLVLTAMATRLVADPGSCMLHGYWSALSPRAVCSTVTGLP